MSPEFWAIIGVGVALAGLQWRMYASLNARLDRIEARIDRIEARIDRIEARMDRIEARVNEIDRRLARVEGQVELLLRGLHIEVQGGDAG